MANARNFGAELECLIVNTQKYHARNTGMIEDLLRAGYLNKASLMRCLKLAASDEASHCVLFTIFDILLEKDAREILDFMERFAIDAKSREDSIIFEKFYNAFVSRDARINLYSFIFLRVLEGLFVDIPCRRKFVDIVKYRLPDEFSQLCASWGFFCSCPRTALEIIQSGILDELRFTDIPVPRQNPGFTILETVIKCCHLNIVEFICKKYTTVQLGVRQKTYVEILFNGDLRYFNALATNNHISRDGSFVKIIVKMLCENRAGMQVVCDYARNLLKILLDSGASADYCGDYFIKYTKIEDLTHILCHRAPLRIALGASMFDIAEQLLKHGANIRASGAGNAARPINKMRKRARKEPICARWLAKYDPAATIARGIDECASPLSLLCGFPEIVHFIAERGTSGYERMYLP